MKKKKKEKKKKKTTTTTPLVMFQMDIVYGDTPGYIETVVLKMT